MTGTLRSTKYVTGISVAVALLAGCAGNGGSLPGSGNAAVPSAHRATSADREVPAEMTLVTLRSVKPNLERRVRDERVMKPNCCALQKTVFITDAFGGSSFTGSVYAFDYVTGDPLGQVAAPPEGFLEVQGACSDNDGNVYFANTEESTIDEYTHSGTFVMALSDAGQFPVDCSYDRSTGNLAVSNIINASGGPGSISIFNGGAFKGTFYPPNMSRAYSIAFQGKTGILWISGTDSSGVFQYDSFAGGAFTIVGIHGVDVQFPGGLAWSAQTKFMNIGAQNSFSAPAIYWIDDKGDVRGETVLECTQQSDYCDVVDFAIKGPGLVAPDAVGLFAARFPYPAGGAPVLEYDAPYVQPIAAAVSSDKPGE